MRLIRSRLSSATTNSGGWSPSSHPRAHRRRFFDQRSRSICDYLDDAYSGHPLYPRDPRQRARARWFEEFADTRLGDLFIWSLFYQKVVRPMVWGEPGRGARRQGREDDIPATLDYLEDQLPADGFLLAISASPTSRSPASSATALMRASKPMTNAGRVPPPSFKRTLTHFCVAALQPFEDVQRSAAIKGRRRRSSMRVLRSLSTCFFFFFGRSRAAQGIYAALTAVRSLRVARKPVLDARPQRPLRWNEARLRQVRSLDGVVKRKVLRLLRPHPFHAREASPRPSQVTCARLRLCMASSGSRARGRA